MYIYIYLFILLEIYQDKMSRKSLIVINISGKCAINFR
jgi:hypothetical protein